MICPACKSPLVVVEYHRIELDYCPHCRGVWFDSGEVELLQKSVGQDEPERFLHELLDGGEARTQEKARRCPLCRRTMKKVAARQEPSLHVDACPNGDGFWFDGGELDWLLKTPVGPGGQMGVTGFLTEVFKGRDSPSPPREKR